MLYDRGANQEQRRWFVSTISSDHRGISNAYIHVELDTPSSNLIKSNHDVQVKLADQQADPNSPLYSVKSFEELGL